MRRENFNAEMPQAATLQPGDILCSVQGKTYRTVLMIDGEMVIVKSQTGTVDSISLQSVCEHWLKMIPKEK